MADDINGPSVPKEAPLDADENVAADASGQTDPNDEIPVPIAMWPSEVDERAQVVEALRGNGPPPRTDTQVDPLDDTQADRA